jgi:phenylalanyl-tRNA synthetase beta chain
MAALYSEAGPLELKRIAECLAPGVHVRPAEPRSWEHPARCAALEWQGREIGRLSEMHPDFMESGRAAVLDIDLSLLRELEPAGATYTPVRKFPTSAFDISVVAGARELAGKIELEIRRFAGELAEKIEYVREYQGERLPEGKKSVSFRIIAGAADRTLTAVEITAMRNGIIEGLTALGYELRV